VNVLDDVKDAVVPQCGEDLAGINTAIAAGIVPAKSFGWA